MKTYFTTSTEINIERKRDWIKGYKSILVNFGVLPKDLNEDYLEYADWGTVDDLYDILQQIFEEGKYEAPCYIE